MCVLTCGCMDMRVLVCTYAMHACGLQVSMFDRLFACRERFGSQQIPFRPCLPGSVTSPVSAASFGVPTAGGASFVAQPPLPPPQQDRAPWSRRGGVGTGCTFVRSWRKPQERERERERGTTLESRDCPVRCAALTGSRLPNQAPAAP